MLRGVSSDPWSCSAIKQLLHGEVVEAWRRHNFGRAKFAASNFSNILFFYVVNGWLHIFIAFFKNVRHFKKKRKRIREANDLLCNVLPSETWGFTPQWHGQPGADSFLYATLSERAVGLEAKATAHALEWVTKVRKEGGREGGRGGWSKLGSAGGCCVDWLKAAAPMKGRLRRPLRWPRSTSLVMVALQPNYPSSLCKSNRVGNQRKKKKKSAHYSVLSQTHSVCMCACLKP